MAAAVLSSGGSSTLDQLLASQILLHALKEKGAIDDIKSAKTYGTPVKADMPQELLNNAGIYGATNQLLTIGIAADGQLSITTPQDASYPAEKYTYTADGSFMNADGSAKLSFVQESNGRTYLWVRQYAWVPNLGQIALSEYAAEKLATNDISEETLAAWKERDGKRYYIFNEKYTSLAFLVATSAQVQLFEDLPGYVLSQRITGPNTAASDLQIPATGSRDTSPVQFYKQEQDGVEYLLSGSNLYISQDAVKPIYSGSKALVTIPTSGNAKWYTIPDRAAGKTLQVSLPAAGSYAVYDENGICVAFSEINAKPIVLPKNGTIVFAGEADSKFDITLN
jgi:hypothetical protein